MYYVQHISKMKDLTDEWFKPGFDCLLTLWKWSEHKLSQRLDSNHCTTLCKLHRFSLQFYSASFSVKMKAHLITSIIFQLICQIFGETIQRGNIENVKPVTSELNNLDLFSSTYQLQKLLQNEVQIVQELEEYLALLRKEIKTVQNFLEKKYENEDMSILNVKGKKVGSVRWKLVIVVLPKVM